MAALHLHLRRIGPVPHALRGDVRLRAPLRRAAGAQVGGLRPRGEDDFRDQVHRRIGRRLDPEDALQ